MNTNILKSFYYSVRYLCSRLKLNGYSQEYLDSLVDFVYSFCETVSPQDKANPFGFMSMTDVIKRPKSTFVRDSFCPVYRQKFSYRGLNYYLYFLRYFNNSNVLENVAIAVFRTRTNYKLFDMKRVFGILGRDHNDNRKKSIEFAKSQKYFEIYHVCLYHRFILEQYFLKHKMAI